MQPFRIVIADDDPQIRSLLGAFLEARGYVVDSANDGVEALELLRTLGSAVDLLITDIKMPRMDGVSLARSVAQLSPLMPVLFISGWADPLEEPEWQKPSYSYLRKPFLPNALFDSVERLLGRSVRSAAP